MYIVDAETDAELSRLSSLLCDKRVSDEDKAKASEQHHAICRRHIHVERRKWVQQADYSDDLSKASTKDDRVNGERLHQRRRRVLAAYMAEHDHITATALATLYEMTPKSAQASIRALIGSGVLIASDQQVDGGKWMTIYRLVQDED